MVQSLILGQKRTEVVAT